MRARLARFTNDNLGWVYSVAAQRYSARMQYLAIRSDRHPTPDVWRKFVHKRDVPCRKCEVVYQLWAPLEPEQDDAAVKAQGEWLSERLEEECPGHADWFHSPEN